MTNQAIPLTGTWEMIRAETAGEDSPDLLSLHITLAIGADTYAVSFGGQVVDRGTFALDETGTPKSLTLTGTVGPNADRTIPCIFQLAGDRLRICYGLDGTAPTSFATAPGTPLYLATYRRKSSD